MQVVRDDVGISGDRILWMDFLDWRAIIDCVKGEMRLRNSEAATNTGPRDEAPKEHAVSVSIETAGKNQARGEKKGDRTQGSEEAEAYVQGKSTKKTGLRNRIFNSPAEITLEKTNIRKPATAGMMR